MEMFVQIIQYSLAIQRQSKIFLYYDDVAVVNPLGSKTSKHKFGKSNQ